MAERASMPLNKSHQGGGVVSVAPRVFNHARDGVRERHLCQLTMWGGNRFYCSY